MGKGWNIYQIPHLETVQNKLFKEKKLVKQETSWSKKIGWGGAESVFYLRPICPVVHQVKLPASCLYWAKTKNTLVVMHKLNCQINHHHNTFYLCHPRIFLLSFCAWNYVQLVAELSGSPTVMGPGLGWDYNNCTMNRNNYTIYIPTGILYFVSFIMSADV